MVNTNTIKGLEDAKKATYNGKPLTDKEKKVFDSSWLKGQKLDQIIRAAWLLDNVKEAELISSKNTERITQLLTSMNNDWTDKRNNWVAYYSINSYNEQVNKAINRLNLLISEYQLNVQGIRGEKNGKINLQKGFKITDANISVTSDIGRLENIQGISGDGGDIELKESFEMIGANISVNRQRTEQDIKDEIASIKQELKRKQDFYNIYKKNNNIEKMEKIGDEITRLEQKIRNLESELRKKTEALQEVPHK